MLAKWWWKNISERNSLWNHIMECKYGDWFSLARNNNNLSHMLESIRSIVDSPQLKIFSNEDYRWNPGSGEKIKFWSDHWVGDEPIMKTFPRMYDLSLDKKATLADYKISFSNHQGNQLQIWRRSLRNWELEEANLIADILSNFSPGQNKDKIFGKLNMGEYSSRSGYKIFNNHGQSSQDKWDWIWKVKVPTPIKTFFMEN